MSERTALYAGSFDPFTLGHLDIARKAAALFDRVVVLVGVNVRKSRRFPAEIMAGAIREALSEAGIGNAQVVVWDGLVTDYCRQNAIGWYVRGLRAAADYAFEEETAQVNRMLCPELETIYLRADHPAISATTVRELMSFGRAVGEFVPPAIARTIRDGGR